MAKRLTQRQLVALKLESLSDGEVQEVLDYLAIIESLRRTSRAPLPRQDDIVELLAEARENQRARQAFEWEATRRRAERRVGIAPSYRT